MEAISLEYVSGLISKDEYLNLKLAELDLSGQCKGIDGCEAFIKGKLKESFWELDKLERTDEFWKQTNNLPTLYKLPEYADYQIKKKINLENSAWLSIVCKLANFSQHLEIEPWKILKENNKINVDFLIFTAWNSSKYWGEESVSAFSKLIKELDLSNLIADGLNELSKISIESKQWINNVHAELKLV
jgi:hypothetical protein